MRRRRRRVGALVVFASLAVALLLAEVALRLAYDEEEANGNYWGRGAFAPSEEAGYRHAPGFRGRAVRPGVFDVEVEIDELGLRRLDRERQLAFPRTLLVLGDSFPFGLGVAADEALPARLAELLNPQGIGVVNGAQTGYDVGQAAAWGGRLIEELRPDAVLLTVFLANDVEDGWFREGAPVEVVDGYRVATRRFGRGTPLDLLRTRSYLWKVVDGRLVQELRRRRRRGAFTRAWKADPESVLARTTEPLSMLASRCAERGIGFAVAMIPRRKGPTPFDERFADVVMARGLQPIDLAGSFIRDEHYFRGDGHWNAAGHATAARRLAAELPEALPSLVDR